MSQGLSKFKLPLVPKTLTRETYNIRAQAFGHPLFFKIVEKKLNLCLYGAPVLVIIVSVADYWITYFEKPN